MSCQSELKHLFHQLNQTMGTDRHGLKRQLDRLRSEAGRGKDVAGQIQQVAEKIERSIGRCNQRRASVPVINYPDLTVSSKKEEIFLVSKRWLGC